MDAEKKDKKIKSLNIVSTKVNHGGFGAGSIDLNNVSGVIIDGDEAYIDIGALHAKSKVEKRIKFTANKEDVPNGRTCWLVWVAVDRGNPDGAYYAGATACEMLIDEEARKGWKVLADHVNRMDYAMKRRIMVEPLNKKELALLEQCLINHNREWWENSTALQEAMKS